jgi:hypothetical protein
MASRVFNSFVWELGFLGKTSRTLLTSFEEYDEGYATTAAYEYKLNSYGYVTEMTCTIKRHYESKPSITIVSVEYK